MRQAQINLFHANAPGIVASDASISRWRRNGVARRPKRGGHVATDIRGEEELYLVLCRLAWPKATADEISAFIARSSESGWIYSRNAIGRCEKRLGLTRKRASTTAYQALTPFNQARRHNFWHLPHPAGIFGTPRARLIDIDEAGIGLEQDVGRKHGKSFTVNRVRQPGVYGRGVKFTLIAAFDCRQGCVYFHFRPIAGTSTDSYVEFLDQLMTYLPGMGDPNFEVRTIMHDNLSSHLNVRVAATINQAGHRVIARPAYRPEDAPCEFAFNTLKRELDLRANSIYDSDDLAREVGLILMNLNSMDAYFVHCGYQ